MLSAVSLLKVDIPVTVTQVFLKYDFLLVTHATWTSFERSWFIYQVGSFIRYSRLKVSVKCCKFLSSGVALKSSSNVMFS